MNANDLKIDFFLSSAGFKVADLEELMPPFMTDYDTRVGLRWMPSATGPESWTLAIVVGILAAEFGKKFAAKMAEDIYGWLKNTVGPFMARRANSHGLTTIRCNDLTVIVWEDAEFRTIRDLAEVLTKVDPAVSKVWHVSVDPDKKTMIIEPDLSEQ